MNNMKSKGFTLVELLIAIAILGIIAAIAWPSYMRYIRKGRIDEARAVMMQDAQFLSQVYAHSYSYRPINPVTKKPEYPALPTTGTEFFTIETSEDGVCGDTLVIKPEDYDNYCIKAVPTAKNDGENRVLRLVSGGSIVVCQRDSATNADCKPF